MLQNRSYRRSNYTFERTQRVYHTVTIRMGGKTSKGSRVSDHVAFSTSNIDVPNIVITSPSPLCSPDSPKPFAPPPTPQDSYHYPRNPIHRAPPPSPRPESEYDHHETSILAGTPPPDHPPPPPPTTQPPFYDDHSFYDEHTSKNSTYGRTTNASPPLPPVAPPPIPIPRTVPLIKRNIVYAKDRVAKLDEGLSTTDRSVDNGGNEYYSIKRYSDWKNQGPSTTKLPTFTPSVIQDAPSSTTTTTTTMQRKTGTSNHIDSYPVYDPIHDYSFTSGKTFQQGAFPIDVNRINLAFCGRQGAGKSTLINALRGIQYGDKQSAGRNPCDNMEPFRFMEDNLQNIVLWEVPYPRAFSSITDVYDRSIKFDKFYDSYKLHLFHHLFVLIPDGAPQDDDITFSKIIHSRRSAMTFLSTKTDDDLDSEARESSRLISTTLKNQYRQRAHNVFFQIIEKKAAILSKSSLLFICSPVIRNIVNGTTGYLHYQFDEIKLIELVGIRPGCHYALENKLRKEREEAGIVTRPTRFDYGIEELQNNVIEKQKEYAIKGPRTVQKATVLADAGFEISYGTDDRVFGNLEPKTMVRRAGKTAFNYGFIGGTGVGKSSMINAMRGMSSKHPLAAGKSRAKPGSCDRYEFDDDLLKYSVTLWELHYPKKINMYFEFIDRHNISNLTAIFVLIDGIPTDEDLSFSKIAHRRNASVVFLSSKTDQKLSSRSRSDEIPVCDLLKQRFVDKGIARFDRALAASAPELCGRVHMFYVSAPVFRALRVGDTRIMQMIVHERAVFDFLKQKRIIADLLESPAGDLKEGLYANVNIDTAGVIVQ